MNDPADSSLTRSPNAAASVNPPRPQRDEQVVQTIVLAVLFAAPALFALHYACTYDPDVWWHLRTGQWIVEHHAVPRTDPFSSVAAGEPWAAYSWLFELLMLKLFTKLGLIGIVAYTCAMVMLTTAALHRLIRRRQRDFTVAVLLTGLGAFGMTHLHTPRSWHFTILFFVLELDILMQARRTGWLRELLWLPVIFALWANTHIQFIDGLVLLALAFAESIANRWLSGKPTRIPALAIAAALLASLLATLANPYGWHIYRVAHDLAAQTGVMNGIEELKAIPFRSATDFCVLFLALGAAAALGRVRKIQPFETALFLLAAYLAFRSQRDIWFIAVVSVAILADAIQGSEKARDQMPAFARPISALLAFAALLAGVRIMHLDNAVLHDSLATALPVKAVEAIQQRGYTGPLFNSFSFGGYLIWALRMPVSIDGRAALYGDQRIDQSQHAWSAQPGWASNPQLAGANLVVAPLTDPLTQLLRVDPRFELVYEDKLAVVFIAHKH